MTNSCQGDSPSFTTWCLVVVVKRPVVLVVDKLPHQDGKAVHVSLWGACPGHLWEPQQLWGRPIELCKATDVSIGESSRADPETPLLHFFLRGTKASSPRQSALAVPGLKSSQKRPRCQYTENGWEACALTMVNS